MRRDGREFISGDQAPRKFSEVKADAPPRPYEDPDEPPPVSSDPPPQRIADTGPHPLSKPVIFRKLRR